MHKTLWLWGVVGIGLVLLGACAASQQATPTARIEPTPTVTATPTRTPRPTSTATPTVATLRVDPATTYQTMDGIGAASYAFPYANDVEWDWDAVKFVFDELDIAYVRLAPWLGWWETANDNDDPYTINWEGFGTVHDIINQHDVPFAQYLHARGIEVGFGVWDFGGVSKWCETCEDWLASGRPRQIPPEQYPEVGESIAAYILNMQANDVPIAFTEVQNEPDIEAGIKYPSPEALRDAGREVVAMLDHFGLDDVVLHAPNLHSPRNNARWIEAWFEDEVLRERTVAVSYHTWWSTDIKNYTEIWEAAQRYGKPVWATEVGYMESPSSIRPDTWKTSWAYARSFYRAIAWSHASRVYLWTILGNDAAVGKQGTRYPMFYIFKHYTNYVPAGAVLVESQADDSYLPSMAFRRPEGDYTLIVLNEGRVARPTMLVGLDARIETAVCTTEEAYEMPLTPDAKGVLTLPPRSISSIVLKP